MDQVRELAAQFRAECAEDYVGLWQISRAIAAIDTIAEHMEQIVAVVGAILDDDTIVIGDFRDGEFVKWKDPRADIRDRLRDELAILGRAPDIGEIAWLTKQLRSAT